ncbi:TPA: hypothetical protein NWA32_004206 [Escherichia coli]|nr:hypothetical protein [Escherichia coli]
MKNFTTALTTALTNRNAVAPSKDIQLALNNAKRFEKALDSLFGKAAFDKIAKKLIARCEIAEKAGNANDFIAVKVLVKIVSASVAIAQKNTSVLDPYSETILRNLVTLQTVNNKTALVSLSRSIEYTEADQQQAIKTRYNCSAGTASTQASSTRMMLEALDICDVQKGKKGDVISFKENDRARLMVSLFADVEPVEDTEAHDETESENA